VSEMTNFWRGWSPWEADQMVVEGEIRAIRKGGAQRTIKKVKRTVLFERGLLNGLLKGRLCKIDSNFSDTEAARVRMFGKVLRCLAGLGNAFYELKPGDESESTMAKRLAKLRTFASDQQCLDFVEMRLRKCGEEAPRSAGGRGAQEQEEEDDIGKYKTPRDIMLFKVRYICTHLPKVLTVLKYMKDFLLDPAIGFLAMYRATYECLRRKELDKVMAPLKELAKMEQVEGSAAAKDCLRKVQKGAGKEKKGIYYVPTEQVLTCLTETFVGFAGDAGRGLAGEGGCAVETILRVIVGRSLTGGADGGKREAERARALLDAIVRENNRESTQTGSDALTLQVKVQGTPPISRSMVSNKTSLFSDIGGFTSRLNHQLEMQQRIAMARVMARGPRFHQSAAGEWDGPSARDAARYKVEALAGWGLLLLAADNFFRQATVRGQTVATRAGPHGEMSLTNFAARLIALCESMDKGMLEYGKSCLGGSSISIYGEDLWGEPNRMRVRTLLREGCIATVGEGNERIFGADFYVVIEGHSRLTEEQAKKCKELLGPAACRKAFERIKIASKSPKIMAMLFLGTHPQRS